MSTPVVPEEPQGQPQAAAPAGTSEQPERMIALTIPRPEKQEEPKEPIKKEEPVQTQPTDKDYRHLTAKMHEEIDEKIRIAEMLVDRDPDAIYDLAESDPALAKSILKRRPDYGAKTVEELMAKKGQEPKEDDGKLKEMEARLLNEHVLRMKKEHPDLKDELEDAYRDMYSDPRFKDYDEEKKLNIARAVTGTTAQQPSRVPDVTLEMLRQNEGVHTSMRSSGTHSEDPARLRSLSAWGYTKEDEKKYLPPNIDEILSSR